jgi:signal transduction histidine kinase
MPNSTASRPWWGPGIAGGTDRLGRLRSLRLRAVLVVTLVACAPLLIVAGFDAWERGAGLRMEGNLAAALEDLEDRSVEDVARAHSAWIRVLEDGQVVSAYEGEIESWPVRMRNAIYRADGAPTLQQADAARPSFIERREIRAAKEGDVVTGCRSTQEGRLLVCHAARVLEDGRIAYTMESSRRPVRAVYDLRYHLGKLTLGTLPVALFLAWWLGRRMVRPLEQLQAQARAQADRGTAGRIELDRTDEFGDLADAFNVLLEALEDRKQANQAFVADLVHEFKNPVAAVRAASEALESGPSDAARAARLARILRDSSQRLDDLVTRFLELARAEAGLPDDERIEVDLRLLVGALADDTRLTIDDGPHRVLGVLSGLESVVRNLIDNALSFADQSSPEVAVTLVREGDVIVLSVADNGGGIAPEDLPRVFDRYFTRRRTGRGTGLGLALVRAVVDAHGGSVEARNGEIGAVFEVRFSVG